MKKFAFAFGLAAMVMFAAPAWAADGKALVASNKCGSCHKMQGPAVTTIAEILKRKAPDLFYAGSKFNKDWLVGFLQSPTKIRPAGTVYSNNIKTDATQQDVIVDPPKCASKLSAGDAAAVADYLMTLKDAGMKTGFTPGKFSKARARMLFTKKQPCSACHTLPKRGGGVSCPTFEGIGARLNPDWMYSFIKNPQHWDPKIWMASGDYDEKTLKLMVNYLSSFK